MPKLKCIDHADCYLHPEHVPNDAYFEDTNGVRHKRYRFYVCDTGGRYTLDVYRNVWTRGW